MLFIVLNKASSSLNMDIGLAVVIFVCSFAIFDAVRKLNNNIIEQTEEIKKLWEGYTLTNGCSC